MKFKMLKDSKIDPSVKAGAIVHLLEKYDYGLADDDTKMTGIEHVSVTMNPDGDYPSFTVPRRDVEPID